MNTEYATEVEVLHDLHRAAVETFWSLYVNDEGTL